MLISKSYKEFFKKVYNEDLQPNQLSKLIEKEIPSICSELKIGKILMSVHLPAFFCERAVSLEKIALFSQKIDKSGKPFSSTIPTYSKGTVTFTSFPADGEFWSTEELSDIDFFHQQLFILFSRSNMNKLIVKAQETDTLTGTLNTAGIMHLGNIIFNRHLIPKFSILFMNIKKFKKINDIVTSKNGDIILRQYSIMITQFLAKDGAIARMGGDNFVILVKSSKLGAILKFLEEVRITVDVDGVKKTAIINVKIGVCQGNPNIPNFEAFLGCAATAFKAAKASQTEDLLFFKPDMGIPKSPKPTYM